jgi:ketosteroid isomerase-like protein
MTTTVNTDVDVIQGMFEAFAKGDLATFADGFHPDATWNHRNPDRLGGVHAGIDAIMAFLAESGRLTGGTLRAIPTGALSDDAGHVAVPVTVSGSRPDGRTFEDHQIMYFTLLDGRVKSADQYIGDPPTVTAFWA